MAEKDPENLPWRDLNIDVVIESTGFFTDKDGAGKHLTAGAKRVVISGPTKSEGVDTIVLGTNDDKVKNATPIVSNASCTTNSWVRLWRFWTRNLALKVNANDGAQLYGSAEKLQDATIKGS